MFLLEAFEARMRTAGFSEILKRQESGSVPTSQVRLLSLDEVQDESIGAKTDDFERSVYRVGCGLALSDDDERLFSVSVEWRVYDLDGFCGVHIGKLEAKDSVAFDALLCPGGGIIRQIYLEGQSYEAHEHMQRERQKSVECIERLVNLYKRAYQAFRS